MHETDARSQLHMRIGKILEHKLDAFTNIGLD